MILVLDEYFRWSGWVRLLVLVYDLTAGRPPGQAEDLMQFVLVAG
jgi:hypothetical protein